MKSQRILLLSLVALTVTTGALITVLVWSTRRDRAVPHAATPPPAQIPGVEPAAAAGALTAQARAAEEAARSDAGRLEILHAADSLLTERALQTRDTNAAREFLADLDAAIARRPEEATLWCARAAVLHLIGDRERALVQFSRGIELASANGDVKTLKDALLRRSALFRDMARGGEAGQDQRRAFDLPLARGGAPDALPDYQKAKEVSAELGQTNRELGLYFLSGADSHHTLASTNGEEAQFYRAGWNYAYFFIDPTFKWALGSNVLIRVEYQLVQGKPIGLQYDGASGAYASATKRVRAPVGNWQVIEFMLPDARFSNRQNLHADFRVYDNERGFYLKRVTVTRYEPSQIPLSVPVLSPRDSAAKPNLIDLTSFYNVTLTNSLQASANGGTGNDLAELSPGVQTLDGIEFDVRGVVHLSCQELKARSGERFPVAVTNIVLNQKFQAIHVLHGAAYREAVGTKIGFYRVHYADGGTISFPIIYGRHVRDWWQTKKTDASEVPQASVAWTGHNAAVVRANVDGSLRLYRATFKNPRPDLAISSIDFVSTMSKSVPFLIAVTGEQ